MISLSYYLSGDIDDLVCTPERPLSDLGAISNKSYWKDMILETLRNNPSFNKATYDISVNDLSDVTKIQPEDIIMTLESMNLVKYWRGSYLLKNVTQKLFDNHFKKKS